MKAIQAAPSPYEAKKIAEYYAELQRADWNEVKRGVMEQIIRAKHQQHLCIQRKLLETYGKEIIEVSPHDSYWGRGPDQKGRNELGKIWMQVREEAIDQIRAGKLISPEVLAQKLEERINQIKLQERGYYASLLE